MRKIEEITTEMMEHVCDKLCKYPVETMDQEELEDICCECEMGRFSSELLNFDKKEV